MSQPPEAREGRPVGAVERSGSNERPSLCAACGECCRTRPGAEDPDRFLAAGDPAGALAAAIASGDWVLARIAGVRYPRPATAAERVGGRAHEGAEVGPCVFLGAEGCRLPFDGRPRMCRELEPWANGECVPGWDLPDVRRAWEPLQALLEEAARRASPGERGRVQPSST